MFIVQHTLRFLQLNSGFQNQPSIANKQTNDYNLVSGPLLFSRERPSPRRMVLEELCVTRCYDDVGLKTSLLVPCLEECFKEGGWTDSLDPSLATSSLTENLPEWVVLVLSGFLVCLSGLFAGLTLGLLSLDPVGLRVSEMRIWRIMVYCTG